MFQPPAGMAPASEPASAQSAAPEAINREMLAANASPQSDSAFFSRLPLEVRQQIYKEMWTAAGLKQHIVDGTEEGPEEERRRWIRMPCIVNQRDTSKDADVRYVEYHQAVRAITSTISEHRPVSRQDTDRLTAWEDRLKSTWCLHWRCDEEGLIRDVTTDIGESLKLDSHGAPGIFFLPLLVCKRL
jgi:hypothetical protein